ncbi:MAG: hypothetical protein ACI9X4_002365, partial [Glaciecola sp.]
AVSGDSSSERVFSGGGAALVQLASEAEVDES